MIPFDGPRSTPHPVAPAAVSESRTFLYRWQCVPPRIPSRSTVLYRAAYVNNVDVSARVTIGGDGRRCMAIS